MDVAANVRRISDFFNDQNIESRNKLRDQSESLLFTDINEVGKKADEITWRRIYHDLMQCYKRTKKQVTPSEIASLQFHFISGIGYYQNILYRLATEYDFDLTLVVPNFNHSYKYCEEYKPEKKLNPSSKEKEAAQQCLHRIFIHLGDIFRYLDELGYPDSRIMAIKWYDAAILFDPTIGMPFNQLGTLFANTNFGFDAAYYYMRCLMCEKSFEGAESNLRRILFSNSRMLKSDEGQFKNNGEESCFIMKKCITQYLGVAKEFFIESSTFPEPRIASLIQDCLTTLKSALELPVKPCSSVKPSFLNPTLIFEMGAMALMFIGHLQNNGIESGILYSAAIAFALNFMLLNVNEFIVRIKNKFISSNTLPKVCSMSDGNTGSSSTGHLSSKENTPDLSPRRALSRLRRRKAALTYDNVESSFIDFEDDNSELSELEETALSTIDALEISSDISETGSVCDEDYTLKSSDEDENRIVSLNVRKSHTCNIISNIEETLRSLYTDTSLPTIKIFCDWLRVDEKLVSFCVESFDGLFSPFAEMLNILKDIERKALASNEYLEKFKYTDSNWVQKYPVTVDWSLIKFKFFEKFHSNFINFDQSEERLKIEEMGFVALEAVISFGHFMTKNMNKSGLTYHQVEETFKIKVNLEEQDKLPSPVGFRNGLKGNANDANFSSQNDDYLLCNSNDKLSYDLYYNGGNISRNLSSNDSSKQKQVMKNMAHQWLKSEVNKLEKAIKVSKVPQLSPYLVVDSSVHMHYHNFVRDLVNSKKFIIVVPKSVLHDLDQHKKMSSNAREAIRWLEGEAQRGSRFVKFLKENERTSLAPIKYPRRRDKDAQDFFAILEYCNFLNQQGKTPTSNKNQLVMATFIYANNNKFPSNAEAIARSAGIAMENVEIFSSKWRNSSKTRT